MTLRIILIIVPIITFLFVSRKLRKSQFQLTDAFFWIIFSIVILLIGIFPGICFYFSALLGIELPVNFVFLVMIFLLLIRNFILNVKIANLEFKLTNLIQELAIRESKNSVYDLDE